MTGREEFVLAEDLLRRAGALRDGPPVPLDRVLEYMAGKGLKVCYYDPKHVPLDMDSAARGLDEALALKQSPALLFVNQDRPRTRQRFSIFHGIGHFCLPGHRHLDYLGRGCLVQPETTLPYERQANLYAAGANMPPVLFRKDMGGLSLGMKSVDSLAQRYEASLESAAIHYATLADAPCAMLWLQMDYVRDTQLRQPDSPLRVRYQVRSPSFPFSIRQGTRVSLEDNLFWLCSEEGFLTEGEIEGNVLGLSPKARLDVECRPQGRMGAVLVFVTPAGTDRGSPIHRDWSLSDAE